MQANLIYYITLLSIFTTCNCFSQTYRSAFDKSDNSVSYHLGQGTSFYINASTVVGGGNVPEPGADALAYLIMYRATKDKKYLDKFIIQSKRVQERRDDNVLNIYQNTPLSIANQSLCNPFPNNLAVPDNTNSHYDPMTNSFTISKGWSYDFEWNGSDAKYCLGWAPTPLYMGKIMFPMAEFVYMVKVEFANELQNLTLPEEANGVNNFKNQYNASYDISGGLTSINTYLDYANWLEIRLKETFDFLESDYWEPATSAICGSTSFGTYCQIVPHCTPSPATDINQQCAMGKTLVYMYLADNSSYKPVFHNHIAEIAKGLWCILNTPNATITNPHANFFQASDGFWAWEEQFNNYTGNFETTAHGIEDAEFLELCYRYNITFQNSTTPLFSELTVKKMANTLANIIYKHPLNFAEFVSGAGGPDNWSAAYWGFMIPYNPYIYQELSDVVVNAALYSNPSVLGSSPGPIQTAYLALAQSPYLYYHSNPVYSNPNTLNNTNFKFNPIAVRRGHSPGSNVYYLASGDFDNNGMSDFVSMDFSNGVLYAYTPDICDNPNLFPSNCWVVAHSANHTPYDAWKGIAGGNFDMNRVGDEILALNNTQHKIYLLKQNGTTFNEESIASSVTWAGLTAGDFDPNNPGDEAVGVASNGDVYLITYNGGIQITTTPIANLGIANIVGVTAGNFDGSTIPQIAVVDNNPGKITIFKYQGGTFSQTYQYTEAGCCNSWNGITAGSFDGDGIDDIAVHRDADGVVRILKIKGGILKATYDEYFPVDQSIRAMSLGKFHLSKDKDALIIFRNFDGQITIFNLDGQCPNAYVDNVTIDENYTINNPYTNVNNNYVVDYHANNTLYASNFNVGNILGTDNSQVNFISGNKIIVTAGTNSSAAYSGSKFHAYIDPSFSCSNPFLRLQHSHSSDTSALGKSIVLSENSKKSNLLTYSNVGIYPNPNTGKFTIEMANVSTNSLVEIYDVMGKKIWSTNKVKNKLTIDIANQPKGIYLVKVLNGNKVSMQKIVYE